MQISKFEFFPRFWQEDFVIALKVLRKSLSIVTMTQDNLLRIASVDEVKEFVVVGVS